MTPSADFKLLLSSSLVPLPIRENNSSSDTEKVFSNRFLKVDLIPSRFGPFSVVTSGSGRGAGLLVVRGGEVLLTHQPRYAVGVHSWEIPRGGSEENESFLQTAVRETKEEVGLTVTPSEVLSLGQVHPDTGILSTTVELFFIRISTDIKKDTIVPDRLETDEVMWIPVEEVILAAAEGFILDSFTNVAILRAKHRNLI